MKKTALIIASFAAMGSVQAATTLTIDSASPSTFGRTAGVYVDFSASTGGDWAPDSLVDLQSYFIDSITLTKNNDVDTFSSLWIGVYTGLSDNNSPSGFLGSSEASVAWGAGEAGDSFTWTFADDFSATVGDGNQLIFMFQSAAGEQSSKLSIAEGDIALQRLGNGPVVDDEGAGIWHGTPGNGLLSDRVPHITLQITQVPEPSVALIGSFGLLTLLRRRR